MACISSNRVCARVVQDKVYQLLINNNKNAFYQQTRNQFTTIGSIYSLNRNNNRQFNGFNLLPRNFTGCHQQVNCHSHCSANPMLIKREGRKLKWNVLIGKLDICMRRIKMKRVSHISLTIGSIFFLHIYHPRRFHVLSLSLSLLFSHNKLIYKNCAIT